MSVKEAAARVRTQLSEAKEGGYLRNGWYFYIDRRDVEQLLEYAERNLTEVADSVRSATSQDDRDPVVADPVTAQVMYGESAWTAKDIA